MPSLAPPGPFTAVRRMLIGCCFALFLQCFASGCSGASGPATTQRYRGSTNTFVAVIVDFELRGDSVEGVVTLTRRDNGKTTSTRGYGGYYGPDSLWLVALEPKPPATQWHPDVLVDVIRNGSQLKGVLQTAYLPFYHFVPESLSLARSRQ